MEDRVRIYSRDGIGLADLRVTAERSWVMNDEGEGEFDIVTNDANCREDFLRFGNWLLIESNKLEPWVGMIDEPQEWKRRYVHVRAYTPERQLLYRDVPKQLRLTGKSGDLFSEIIRLTNRAEQTIIDLGDIWIGGTDFPAENMTGDNLQAYLKELAKRADAEYDFTPIPANGKLSIAANWYKRTGTLVPMPLEESYNLADENNSLRLQGKIYNELWGYGNGGGQTDRPLATFEDQESINLYGLRQGSKTYSDYNDAGSVLNALRNEINISKQPKNSFKLAAVDVGTTLNNIRKGNTHPLRMWSVGFGVNTNVRIYTTYYSPYRGKLDLEVREVTSDIAG